MINVNDFKPGVTFEWDNEIYLVLESIHSKQGRGQANVKTKVKNLRKGIIKTITFTGGDRVKKAHIKQIKMSFLYNDGSNLIFMDQTSYEQVGIETRKLEWEINFLNEGLLVNVISFENEILGVILPQKIELEIIETTDAIRGDTISNATKEAILETGLKVQVPLFIKKGEKVIISSLDGKYISRA